MSDIERFIEANGIAMQGEREGVLRSSDLREFMTDKVVISIEDADFLFEMMRKALIAIRPTFQATVSTNDCSKHSESPSQIGKEKLHSGKK